MTTPLAHKVLKELTLPQAKRTFADTEEGAVLSRLADIHCFELTDVYEAAFEMASDVGKIVGGEETLFLPAPKTWLEFRITPLARPTAFLLQENGDTILVSEVVDLGEQSYFGTMATFEMSLQTGLCAAEQSEREGWHREGFAPENLIPVMLAFINTPRVIGRRQHDPHRGLQKRLTQAEKERRPFPLNRWTEILLRVSPPEALAGDEQSRPHLTGQKALHFCRAHLRIRLGRLEVVKAHWRGDASLGVVRSRYRVKP